MIPALERCVRESIFFADPFLVEGAGVQPAGAYTVETNEALIEELSFIAYRRVSMSILLPLHPGGTSYQQLPIEANVVAAARQRSSGTAGDPDLLTRQSA